MATLSLSLFLSLPPLNSSPPPLSPCLSLNLIPFLPLFLPHASFLSDLYPPSPSSTLPLPLSLFHSPSSTPSSPPLLLPLSFSPSPSPTLNLFLWRNLYFTHMLFLYISLHILSYLQTVYFVIYKHHFLLRSLKFN